MVRTTLRCALAAAVIAAPTMVNAAIIYETGPGAFAQNFNFTTSVGSTLSYRTASLATPSPDGIGTLATATGPLFTTTGILSGANLSFTPGPLVGAGALFGASSNFVVSESVLSLGPQFTTTQAFQQIQTGTQQVCTQTGTQLVNGIPIQVCTQYTTQPVYSQQPVYPAVLESQQSTSPVCTQTGTQVVNGVPIQVCLQYTSQTTTTETPLTAPVQTGTQQVCSQTGTQIINGVPIQVCLQYTSQPVISQQPVYYTGNSAAGLFSAPTAGFVGLELLSGGQTYYGWAEFAADPGTASLDLIGLAYEDQAGTGVAAGALTAVPEPGTLSLLGLSLASLGVMRRRKTG